MQQAYKISLLYFLTFCLLLLLSATLLFSHKIGFTPNAVAAYYLGSEIDFTRTKSDAGILKIILPHIFAYALLLMVLLHFLRFTHYKNKHFMSTLIGTLFITAFFEVFTPYLILHISVLFAYAKLASLFLLFILILSVLYLLFASIAFSKNR
ncbi:MAG TPA: hypothetical protein CFH84_09640 [Sulfurimonas sp. UBA12504]|nr:MAG: hypothetical protein A2019_01765 [Sulfurimonas sp. GWF2_37_8]DAB29412.1 MAG TPA: hypothetical protein CFH84_09640 [Sulfurimonas sp. UBA12504]